ncbi:hypothetical protein FH972_001116 [Carpinus fangiana]|uniref:Uncharacterized protein n=1 Tax=Carpinus fangiana TaxID=176857 RepID=A0A5N6QAY7_9ROSI|nr:hypothetical protein FH972_001116 [Carpinus fangiana]
MYGAVPPPPPEEGTNEGTPGPRPTPAEDEVNNLLRTIFQNFQRDLVDKILERFYGIRRDRPAT